MGDGEGTKGERLNEGSYEHMDGKGRRKGEGGKGTERGGKVEIMSQYVVGNQIYRSRQSGVARRTPVMGGEARGNTGPRNDRGRVC